MPFLWGRSLTRAEVLSHVGDISQVAGARPCVLANGPEDGLRAIELYTGGGLEFTVVPGRGMDISATRVNGRSLAWRAAPTDFNAALYEPEELGWLRTFAGGMLVTAGLTYMGAPCVDQGVRLGLHGRVSHTPARNVACSGEWRGDEYIVSATGCVREAAVFGDRLSMTRTISIQAGKNRIFLHDVVENEGAETAPHMILYHMNAGWPLVDAGTRFVAPSAKVTPRDADAADGADTYNVMHDPTAGYREKVYFHTMTPGADGKVTAALVNPILDGGMALTVTYRPDELPCFTQWKMLGVGAYVVGMEPGNAHVLGRDQERAAGRLQFLEPGERREYHIEIAVLTGEDAQALLVG